MGKDASAVVAFQRQLSTGDLEGVKKSIEDENCLPNQFNTTGQSPMYFAVRGDEPECVSLLHKVYNVEVTEPCTHPRLDADTPAKVAAMYGALQTIPLLHEFGVDFTAPCDRLGNVPARYAVTNNQPEVLKLLVEDYGVKLNDVKDHYGNTLVFFAVMKDEPETLKMLFELGMDIEKPCDAYGFTPACFAALNEKTACLKMLHECGVDLGAECDSYQNTPAKWAVCEDMQQSLKTLYLCEVDLTAPCDEYEHTPKELAVLEDNEEVDELLDAMLLPDELKPWICEQCGLENQDHLTTCSVCGVKRAKNPRRVLVPH